MKQKKKKRKPTSGKGEHTEFVLNKYLVNEVETFKTSNINEAFKMMLRIFFMRL
jgi:hypothetical protein